MKSYLLKSTLLSVAAMIAATTYASNAPGATAPGAKPPSGEQGRSKSEPANNPKVEAILKETRAKVQALIEDKTLSAADRDARIEAIHKSTRERILPLLPKDEQEKFLQRTGLQGNARFKQDPAYESNLKRRQEAEPKAKK